ncbi:MAG: hypothetical protein RSG22_17580 [Comamonas sp.]
MIAEDVAILLQDPGVIVDQQPSDVLVVPVSEAAVFIEDAAPSVITLDEDSDLLVLPTEETRVVIAAGQQGPAGPPGPAGGAGDLLLTRTAGVPMSALLVVYELGGKVYPLSHDDAAHVFAVLGLTVSSGQTGAQISIQLEGTVSDSGWSWAYGRVYLGQGGQLTQTPPADGFSVLIGFAATPTSINLSISDPIEV